MDSVGLFIWGVWVLRQRYKIIGTCPIAAENGFLMSCLRFLPVGFGFLLAGLSWWGLLSFVPTFDTKVVFVMASIADFHAVKNKKNWAAENSKE